MIFLIDTKCKIRFIYVRFNCKRKKGGYRNGWKLCPLGGGGGRPTLNGKFHFKYQYCFSDYPLNR